MSNLVYGIIVSLIFGLVLYYAVEAWDRESDAREARVAKIVEGMKGESK